MMTCPYGFRIVGATSESRRLIDWAAAFAAYASLDERATVCQEAYLSAFGFGEDFRQLLDATGSARGFDGVCWSPWLWFDIDRADNLDRALLDSRKLAAATAERFQLDDGDLLLFYSGFKGFHLGLPTCLWRPEPSLFFNRVARRFAESIAERIGVTIDASVYSKVIPFRAPNSQHPKTGKHKRQLNYAELMGLSLDAILHLAEQPSPFDIPVPSQRCEQAAADWQAAIEAVEREAEGKAHRRTAVANGTPRLNRATLDFIRDGAEPGDRHRLLLAPPRTLPSSVVQPRLRMLS